MGWLYKPKKIKLNDNKKNHFANTIVILTVVEVNIFVAVLLFLHIRGYPEFSPTVVNGFFTMFIGELFMLAGIKISKVVKEKKSVIMTEELTDAIDIQNQNEAGNG